MCSYVTNCKPFDSLWIENMSFAIKQIDSQIAEVTRVIEVGIDEKNLDKNIKSIPPSIKTFDPKLFAMELIQVAKKKWTNNNVYHQNAANVDKIQKALDELEKMFASIPITPVFNTDKVTEHLSKDNIDWNKYRPLLEEMKKFFMFIRNIVQAGKYIGLFNIDQLDTNATNSILELLKIPSSMGGGGEREKKKN